MPQTIQDLLKSSHKSLEEDPQFKLQEKITHIKKQDQEDLTAEKASQLGLSYVKLTGFPIGPEVLRIIPEKKAIELKIICFFHQQNNLKLATSNPNNPEVLKLAQQIKKQFPEDTISLYLTSETSFKQALNLYKGVAKFKARPRNVIITEKDLNKFRKEINSFGDLNIFLSTTTNMTDIFIILVAAAINFKASDIHVEAEEQNIKIRYRLDGMLQDVATMPQTLWSRVVNRIKDLSHLKINVSDIPQDGRLTIKLKKEQIDIRVSTIPSAFGESIVMRLLSSKAGNLDLKKLGLRPEVYQKIEEQINRPNGMILTTGPTGSGKTTTLYAILTQLNKPETKIITLEEPIEYKIKGITQSQVDVTKDYGFNKGLKSILRQDPDIVMVGEIRDLETADTAIQAALTGHLMLSTIHTNDAAGAIPRFISMGVKPFLLAPALNVIIGQRLVRKICPYCKTETSLTTEQTNKIKEILEKLPPDIQDQPDLNNLKFYDSPGCPKCNKLGYQGRIGVFEALVIDRNIEAIILSNEISEYVLRDAASSQKMITMTQDGLLKALQGITSVKEIFRVTEQK